MEVDLVDLVERDREHLAHPALGRPCPRCRHIRDLEHEHVTAVAASPLDQPPGRGPVADRRDDLQERVAEREHGVAQAEVADALVGERLTERERRAQRSRDGIKIGGGDHGLAQPDRGSAGAAPAPAPPASSDTFEDGDSPVIEQRA